jgi:hypothetical protein
MQYLPWGEIFDIGEKLILFALDMATSNGATADDIAAYVARSKLARGIDVLAHQAAERALFACKASENLAKHDG